MTPRPFRDPYLFINIPWVPLLKARVFFTTLPRGHRANCVLWLQKYPACVNSQELFGREAGWVVLVLVSCSTLAAAHSRPLYFYHRWPQLYGLRDTTPLYDLISCDEARGEELPISSHSRRNTFFAYLKIKDFQRASPWVNVFGRLGIPSKINEIWE